MIISIPGEQRTVRKRLYGALRWAGLGNPTPGIWLTPHVDRGAEVDRVIGQVDLRASTLSFVGQPTTIGLSVAEIIERSWDLETVAATYTDLLDRFSRLDPAPGDEVLLAHLELTSALRHFPFIDPQLPEALTPDGSRPEATRRLRELDARWSVGARARWRSRRRLPPGRPPAAAAAALRRAQPVTVTRGKPVLCPHVRGRHRSVPGASFAARRNYPSFAARRLRSARPRQSFSRHAGPRRASRTRG